MTEIKPFTNLSVDKLLLYKIGSDASQRWYVFSKTDKKSALDNTIDFIKDNEKELSGMNNKEILEYIQKKAPNLNSYYILSI